MRFHCLLPVRDEADIIGQCLDHLLTWADSVWVFDTGSVDDSWEIVQDAAARDKRVRPIVRDPVYYSEPLLRGYMFHKAREEMRDGDWFLRVDADEFHHVPPPEFIRSRLKRHETIVYHQYYDFQLLESEAEKLQDRAAVLREREMPIEERRRHFIPSVYAEPRLCKYRETMKWPKTASFPVNAGFVAKERLPIRHYPHRDPIQLDRRCRLRAIMLTDKENRKHWRQASQHHWTIDDWRKFVVEDDDERLRYWKPGQELPRIRQTNHLAPPAKRFAQRLVHAFALPVLDRRREPFPEDAYPQSIPAEVQEVLERELAVGEDTARKSNPEEPART